MNHVKVAIALSWAPAAFDRSRTEAERDERAREILELLKGIGED